MDIEIISWDKIVLNFVRKLSVLIFLYNHNNNILNNNNNNKISIKKSKIFSALLIKTYRMWIFLLFIYFLKKKTFLRPRDYKFSHLSKGIHTPSKEIVCIWNWNNCWSGCSKVFKEEWRNELARWEIYKGLRSRFLHPDSINPQIQLICI